MAYDKRFDQLTGFSEDILKEIIREGEVRLDAQLQAANASDQRAMAWAGFLITIALASVGAAFSLSLTGEHLVLAGIAFGFAVSATAAAAFAMRSARPTEFCFPGNLPENWLPENWTVSPSSQGAWSQARREQASALNNRIYENARWAEEAGRNLRQSMDFLLLSVCIWTALAVLVTIFGG